MRDRLRSINRIDNDQNLNRPYQDQGGVAATADPVLAQPDPFLAQHGVEQTVWKELQAVPGVSFPSLVVRRTRDGVCLHGVMETETDELAPDVASVVRRVAPILKVMNCIVVRERCRPQTLPR